LVSREQLYYELKILNIQIIQKFNDTKEINLKVYLLTLTDLRNLVEEEELTKLPPVHDDDDDFD
jgi:hypothetical protein